MQTTTQILSSTGPSTMPLKESMRPIAAKVDDEITDRIIRHSFFRGMKAEHLAVVTECAEKVHFDTGQILFREGDFADRFFLIESGCIALEAHEPSRGTKLVAELSAGDVLGWSWLFPPFSWGFGARAVEPTSAIVLRGSHLLATAEKDHDFGFELMKRVSQVLIHRLQTARKHLLAASQDSVRL